MNILLIHGRDQQGHDPSHLQSTWESALGEGLARAGLARPAQVKFSFPFYGDELDRMVRELDAPLMAEVVARGGTDDAKELQFRGEVFAELAAANGLSDADIQAELEPEAPVEHGPLNWKWVHALMRALDRTPLGEQSIDRFTRDVWVYLNYPAVRDKIDGIVSAALTDGEWLVIGHSLGTVVGYNVLRAQSSQRLRVRRYITVGSPLGIRAIRRRLISPLEMPGCVQDWYNAYDPRDAVALYPLDAHNFPITPPILNYGKVNNTTDNRHGIGGYLNDAEVTRMIVT
jgi:predicted alpha/beta hydrolase family esterase